MSHVNTSSDDWCETAPAAPRAIDFAPALNKLLTAPLIPVAGDRELAVVTHELRNSLGVVRNAARLLRLPLAAGNVDTARVLIERHVLQMSLHLQELLDTSQPGERRRGLRLEHVDLRVIAGFAIDDIASDLVRRGHRLTVNLPPESIFVHA